MDYDIIWKQMEQMEKKSIEEENDDQYNEILPCKSCGILHTMCADYASGTLVCKNCGVVIESDRIDDTPEWAGSGEDYSRSNPCRVGCPINPLLEKSSLSTMIQGTRTNGFMKRLHSQISMNYVERSRYHIFVAITNMAADKGHLKPAIVEQAKYYYSIISMRKLSRGQIRKGLIACCILYACKNMNVPRSVKEISLMTDVSVTVINKTTKIFLAHMNDILLQTSQSFDSGTKARYCDFVFEAIDSSDLIIRYCNNLHLQDKTLEIKLVHLVKKMDNFFKDTGLMECKTPSAVTCGYIYNALMMLDVNHITKAMLSKLYGLSIVTINKMSKLIIEHYPKLNCEEGNSSLVET